MTGRVIKEYPVVLTKSLAKELYVFEYPLKDRDTKEFQNSIFTGRMKPECQMVELDLSLNVDGPNYNKLKGRDIAEGMAGSADYDDEDEGPMLEKIVYRSDPPAEPESVQKRMGVLYRRGGKLFISPITGYCTMLPTMDHMERKNPMSEAPSNEPQLRAVNVRVGRPENDGPRGRRDLRFSVWRRRVDAEPWVHCRYSAFDTDIAGAQRQALVTGHEAESAANKLVEFVDQRRYLDLVAPKTGGEESKSITPSPSNTVSLSQLKRLPLDQQVRILLTNAKVMRFSRLVETLRFAGSAESEVHLCELLRAVQDTAVLVHACWVVKSEILYPENTFSAHSGVPRDLLVRGRDYILWKFTQNCAVTRKEISSVIKLPTEEVTEMMQQIARQRRPTHSEARHRRRKWEFIFDDDRDFSRRYPDMCEAQEKMWDARFQQLCSALRLDHQRILRDRRRSGRCSSSSDTDYALPVDSGSRRRRRSRSASSTGSGGSPDGRPRPPRPPNRSRSSSECQSPTKPPAAAADFLRPACEPPSFPSAGAERDLRQFVAEKLHHRLVVALSEMAGLFRLHLPRLGLAGMEKERLDALLVEAARREGGVELDAVWPGGLKRDRLLAAKVFVHEEALQAPRDCLLQLFCEAPGITLAQFRQRVKEVCDAAVDDNAFRKLLKMYCVFKGKYYYLRWTRVDGE